METKADPNQSMSIQRRLNPFALPAETNSRFNLFVIAAIMWVVNWTVMIWAWLVDVSAVANTTAPTSDLSDLLWLQVGIPVVTIILAVIFYIIHPQRIVHRQRLQPLESEKDVLFAQAVEQLSDMVQLKKTPSVMLSQTKSVGGQAFGLHNRYILRLNAGMRLAVRKAPTTFRTIVLHELAHIANCDVGRTYFSQSLWTATIWLAIVPLFVALSYHLLSSRLPLLMSGAFTGSNLYEFLGVSLPWFLLILSQFCLGLLLVAAIRASLLRVREFYADWRAATWGEEQSLVNMLKRSGSDQTVPVGLKARLNRIVRLHPTNVERVDFLQEPDKLFIMAYDIPLFVGWLTSTILFGAVWLYVPLMGIVFEGGSAFMSFVEPFVQGSFNALVGNLLLLSAYLNVALMIILAAAPFPLVAYLVIQSVGIQVLQEVLRDLTNDQGSFRSYMRLLLASLLLTVGLYLGIATSPYAYYLFPVINSLRSVPSGLILFTLLVWPCMASLRYFGGLLLGSHIGGQLPVWKWRILLIIFSLLLGAFFAVFFGWNFANVARYSSLAETIGDGDAALIAEFEFVVWIGFSSMVLVIFLANWSWLKLWHWLRPIRCPACRRQILNNCVIGQVCNHCGAELASWLLLAKPSVV